LTQSVFVASVKDECRGSSPEGPPVSPVSKEAPGACGAEAFALPERKSAWYGG